MAGRQGKCGRRESFVSRGATAVTDRGEELPVFNKYRPANETYIFLFRKGEQGRNAVEIPMFDKPISEKEAEIAKLRGPAAASFG